MEAEDWLQIVITGEHSQLTAEKEASRIISLLESGAADFVHLRKPSDPERVASLLQLIPTALHERLRVHRHRSLMPAHLYHARAGEDAPSAATRSCHTLEEVSAHSESPYLFLSPVFDSISKPGYLSAFNPASLAGALQGKRVVALGGVTPRKFLQLRRAGFSGAAMLGRVWSDAADDAAFLSLIEEMNRWRRLACGFHLQFITSAPTAESTAAQALEAIEGGCRWVQVRMKDAPEQEVATAVRLISARCRRAGAALIVDDHVELAAHMPEVDGVHLGHADMPRPQARSIIGQGKAIGSTANTPSQAVALAPVSDYLGVGPYRFTTTKKNLAPTLGADGLRQVSDALSAADMTTPVVAIGGIEISDVSEVLAAGVQGVAVSGAIHAAASPSGAARSFISAIDEYINNRS